MKLTSKKTGKSFNLSGKGAADFFYAKNARGQYINDVDNYVIDDNKNEISNLKFFLGCVGMLVLLFSSFMLHIYLNY